jgi:transcription antitermination protein NusB
MGARRRGREAALQILFAIDSTGVAAEVALRDHFAFLAASVEGREYSEELVRGVMANAAAVDEMIRKVSEHWRIERMPRVDRNILRLSAFELMFLPQVPRRVTLNEAIELAKRYGGEGSPGFVNGVLDRIASEMGK